MIDQKYEIIKDLSSGSYGKVGKGIVHGNPQYQTAAVKVYIKKQKDSDGEVRHFLSECEALNLLRHPYIVQMIDYNEGGTQVDEVGHETSVRYAALQLAENGNLLDYVVDRNMNESVVRYYFRQLIEAIDYMHSSGVGHRDLKLENILLDEYNVKVSDFGFATSLTGGSNDNKLYECKGTLRYMAPEIFKGTGYLGRSVDIFALGVILFSMLVGKPPFARMAALNDSLYFLIQGNQFDGYWNLWDSFAMREGFSISDEFKQLFIALICYYPNTRLSLREILKSKWMSGPMPNKKEVIEYMESIKKDLQENYQQQYGQQENANSNFHVNIKNSGDFNVHK